MIFDSTQNAPLTVCRPGSTRTCWGSSWRSLDPLTGLGAPERVEGLNGGKGVEAEGQRSGRDGKKKREKREREEEGWVGKGREKGKGGKNKPSVCDSVIWNPGSAPNVLRRDLAKFKEAFDNATLLFYCEISPGGLSAFVPLIVCSCGHFHVLCVHDVNLKSASNCDKFPSRVSVFFENN